MTPESDLLRVAYPRTRNAQQTGVISATMPVTSTQHTSLKALARRVLECNNQCNNNATTPQNTAQRTPLLNAPIVARKNEAESALRIGNGNLQHGETVTRFIELVRAIAACSYQRLLHRDDILAALDERDWRDLNRVRLEDRQAWAELLAHRLAKSSGDESEP